MSGADPSPPRSALSFGVPQAYPQLAARGSNPLRALPATGSTFVFSQLCDASRFRLA
jgi:hypothetical protein